MRFLTLLNYSPYRANDEAASASAADPKPAEAPASTASQDTTASPPAADKSLLGDTETKAAEGDKKPDGEAPKAFDFKELKLPENFSFADEAQGKAFSDLAVKYGLSQEAAQALFDYGANAVKAVTEGNVKQFTETAEKWVGQIKSDPDIGDPKDGLKPEVKASIGKVMDQYGSKELRAAFDSTGAGNNPDIVKFLWKVSKGLTEGGLVPGQPGGQRGKRPGLAEAIYPELAAEAAKTGT